jgi:hypothetical protein
MMRERTESGRPRASAAFRKFSRAKSKGVGAAGVCAGERRVDKDVVSTFDLEMVGRQGPGGTAQITVLSSIYRLGAISR